MKFNIEKKMCSVLQWVASSHKPNATGIFRQLKLAMFQFSNSQIAEFSN